MATRIGSAVWDGTLKQGKGTMKLGSGAFEGPYSFSSRFEEGKGTNAPLPSFIVPLPCFNVPSQTADPVRVAIVLSPLIVTGLTIRAARGRAQFVFGATAMLTIATQLRRAACARAKCRARTNLRPRARQCN